jgi:uncharacterized cupin superfamily protein
MPVARDVGDLSTEARQRRRAVLRRALIDRVLATTDERPWHVAMARGAGCWFSSHMTNLNNPDFDDRGVDGFRVRRARLAHAAGAMRVGVSLWEIPPGEAAYPYHWHVVDEEVIVVLDDGLSLRGHNGRWRALPRGEVVAFPVGTEGGHQLRNRGKSHARFLSVSSGPSEGHDIVFYPDSGKVGVFAENRYELFRRRDAVDFWDGEIAPGAD